jgi:hypothetical protein
MELKESDLFKLVSYCKDKLPLSDATLGREYYYAHMPLCVIDSVFSISVRYEGVRNTIQRFSEHYHINIYREQAELPASENQIPVSGFIKLLKDSTPEELASNVYKNRQRTSSKNGMLKAEAVCKFLKVLKNYKAEYFQDIPSLYNNRDFEEDIKHIPGQGSGISLNYFFMLAGSETLIKPDRMVINFLENVVGYRMKFYEAQIALASISEVLNTEGISMNPRLLDHVIWNYQRVQQG